MTVVSPASSFTVRSGASTETARPPSTRSCASPARSETTRTSRRNGSPGRIKSGADNSAIAASDWAGAGRATTSRATPRWPRRRAAPVRSPRVASPSDKQQHARHGRRVDEPGGQTQRQRRIRRLPANAHSLQPAARRHLLWFRGEAQHARRRIPRVVAVRATSSNHPLLARERLVRRRCRRRRRATTSDTPRDVPRSSGPASASTTATNTSARTTACAASCPRAKSASDRRLTAASTRNRSTAPAAPPDAPASPSPRLARSCRPPPVIADPLDDQQHQREHGGPHAGPAAAARRWHLQRGHASDRPPAAARRVPCRTRADRGPSRRRRSLRRGGASCAPHASALAISSGNAGRSGRSDRRGSNATTATRSPGRSRARISGAPNDAASTTSPAAAVTRPASAMFTSPRSRWRSNGCSCRTVAGSRIGSRNRPRTGTGLPSPRGSKYSQFPDDGAAPGVTPSQTIRS